MWIFDYLKGEWHTVRRAPMILSVAILIGGVFTWNAINWIHQQRFDSLRDELNLLGERIRLRDDQILSLKLLNASRSTRSLSIEPNGPLKDLPNSPNHSQGPPVPTLAATKTDKANFGSQTLGLTPSDPCHAEWVIEQGGQHPIAPCLFTLSLRNRGYVIAVMSDGSVIALPDTPLKGSRTRGARPGEVVSIYAVGLGPASDGNPGMLKNPLSVHIGGRPVDLIFAGIVQRPGLGQIVFTLPKDLPEGDLLIEVDIAGVPSQKGLFIPVRLK